MKDPLDTLGQVGLVGELIVAMGESEKVERETTRAGCQVNLQMRLLRHGEVKGLVQGPRARMWELDLNPSQADWYLSKCPLNHI